jgi:hypothetical protein
VNWILGNKWNCCGIFGDYYRFYLPFPILIEHYPEDLTDENFLYGFVIIDLIIITTILYSIFILRKK